MECVFVRHGEASLDANSDFERLLTPVGEVQVIAASQWLARHWRADRVLVSPYHRAQQTAAAFIEAMPGLAWSDADFLTPDTNLSFLNDALAERSEERLLLVGHNPLFSNALSWFCGEDLREVMAPASMARIDMTVAARGFGRLQWLRHAPDYSTIARRQ